MVKIRTVVLRSLKRLCPNCGQTKLFSGYLQQVSSCSMCQENYAHIRADDGPAWLTILMVGHLLAPFILMFPTIQWPVGALVVGWSVLAVGLMAVILPFSKALMISLIWRTQKKHDQH